MGNVLPTYVSNPLQMTFTEKGRKISNWEFGRMWGFPDSGALFSIPGRDRGFLLYTCAIGRDGLNFIHYAFSFSGTKADMIRSY